MVRRPDQFPEREQLMQHLGQSTLTPALPRLELPQGVSETPTTTWDTETSRTVSPLSWQQTALRARKVLRAARRLQRRGAGRPAVKGRRGQRELKTAREHLLLAGVLCGIAEVQKANLTPIPERVARIRERCIEQCDREPAAFAITVENWCNDLAGVSRLTRA